MESYSLQSLVTLLLSLGIMFSRLTHFVLYRNASFNFCCTMIDSLVLNCFNHLLYPSHTPASKSTSGFGVWLFFPFLCPEEFVLVLSSESVSYWIDCLCFVLGFEPMFLASLGKEGWSWHEACWDRVVKPRILNISCALALGIHLSMTYLCYHQGSSFIHTQGRQLPRLGGGFQIPTD